MFDVTEIAAARNVPASDLYSAIKEGGWEFERLDHSDPAHVAFATRVVTDYADRIAARIKARAERDAKLEANRTASQTAAAKANPSMACTRCDGKGRIRGFGHIEGGKCFACGGAGVRRLRAA